MRVLVHVPDAYLLLRPLGAVRPGLQVLDADGRRIASISLANKPSAASVVESLTNTSSKKAREFFSLGIASKHHDVIVKSLVAIKGVDKPEIHGGRIEVWAEAGVLTIPTIESITHKAQASVEFVDPVETSVALRNAKGDDAQVVESIATLAGVRYTRKTTAGRSAWISRPLLSLDALKLAGLSCRFVKARFAFENLPKGGGAVGHFKRAAAQAGVVSIVPNAAAGTIDVIGMIGAMEEAKVRDALVAGGLKLKK